MLALHVLDVEHGPLVGIALIGDGGVFGRQTEGVPTHGVQHVEAAHAFVARQGVADGVVAEVADVQHAARIRQHFEHVELGLGGILLGLKERGVPTAPATSIRFASRRTAFRAWLFNEGFLRSFGWLRCGETRLLQYSDVRYLRAGRGYSKGS